MSADRSVPHATVRRLQDEINDLARVLNSQVHELAMSNATVYCATIHAIRHLTQASNSLALAARQLHAVGGLGLLDREVGQ